MLLVEMRSISVQKFGGPEVLQLREVPDLMPGPDQLLIRLHAAGVNPVDSYIRSGSYAKLPPLPYTPGMDGAGVVQAAGSQVRGYRKGQRVYLSNSLTGTYAEHCLCLPTQIHPLPRQLSFEEGACLGIPYATASYALFHRGGAKRGQSVLIHGATGGVGIAAVQLARRAGLRVFATGGSEKGRQMLEDQGAEHVFDHHQPGYHQDLLESTGGAGVDLIVEMLANVNLGRNLPLLAQNGCVVVVGSRGPVQILPRDLMQREADIRGAMILHAPSGVQARIHSDMLSGLTEGSLKPVLRAVFPLAEANAAAAMLMQPGACGKIVLSIPPSNAGV
jgi:NADPH2:quinone reductase